MKLEEQKPALETGTHGASVSEQAAMNTLACAHCGAGFKAYRSVHRYCSEKCRSAARKGPVLACQLCSRDFRAKGKPRPGREKFCSRKCYDDKGRADRTGPEPEAVDGCRWLGLGGGRFALVDADVYETVKDFKWYFGAGRASDPSSRYAVRSQPRGTKPHLVYLHRLIADPSVDQLVDHRNENKLDNRRENLRVCGNSGNRTNQARGASSASGYRGVGRSLEKWSAAITHNNKSIHLGNFETPEMAARARDDAARRLHGAFAVLNFPNEGERGVLRADESLERKAA